MRSLRRICLVAAGLLLTAGCERACGGKQATPAASIPTIKGPDGAEYVLLARGAYKPVYDAQGKLDRVEYDRNGDGRADQIARHNGKRLPELLEDDDDFDGQTDRWAYYDAAGVLVKVGASRRGAGRPDFWAYQDRDGKITRQEYDSNGDGKLDRVEIMKDGRVDLVEVDANDDGRPDRWQKWQGSELIFENLDTDGDGKPDKRLRYGPKGEVIGLEPIADK
ncbi:MAG: hypothetical protein AB7O37_02525 [Vicinamibacteria bacterium]